MEYALLTFAPKPQSDIDQFILQQHSVLNERGANLLALHLGPTQRADGDQTVVLSELLECKTTEASNLARAGPFVSLVESLSFTVTDALTLKPIEGTFTQAEPPKVSNQPIPSLLREWAPQLGSALIGAFIGSLTVYFATQYETSSSSELIERQIQADRDRYEAIYQRRRKAIAIEIQADLTGVTARAWPGVLETTQNARILENVLHLLETPFHRWNSEELSLFDREFIENFAKLRMMVETANNAKDLYIERAGPGPSAEISEVDAKDLEDRSKEITLGITWMNWYLSDIREGKPDSERFGIR